MSSTRMVFRVVRPSLAFKRPISRTTRRMVGPGKAKEHEGTEGHRKIQSEKPLNPHLTSTNSTIASKMPSVGKQKVPPELITSIEPDFVPKDSVPENTERMTGGTQKGVPDSGLNANIKAGETSNGGELGVGELQGGEFRVEPLRRSGEDGNTMRARLLYQSRKRGTLESDLLMSTFAEAHLRDMTLAQMTQYDRFLDENDWDIYYWATQEPTPTSQETAEGAGREPEGATANASGLDKSRAPKLETDDEWRQGKPRSGEWAQTVGTFKPAYRPVPARWKNTEILAMLRRHVISRSAGGVLSDDSLSQDVKKPRGGGMAFMPPVFETDRP